MPAFNIPSYGTGTFAATNSITKENFKSIMKRSRTTNNPNVTARKRHSKAKYNYRISCYTDLFNVSYQ